MVDIANLLVVTAGLCVNLYGLHTVIYGIPLPGYGGQFQYLTIIGLTIATTSLVVRIINLLTGFLKPVYETLSAIATPVEGLISILYWPIVLYDRTLLLPEGLEYDLPLILDLSIHLIPTIVCWIDLLVYNKDFKRSPTHILAIYIFGLSYFYWANLCFENNGYWVYPLLGKFGDMQRAFFFLFCSWGGALIYKAILKAHSLIHVPTEVKQKQEMKKTQ
ncbi:FAR-17a/AIG1-like protein-domain-containing protein [Thamnidium elegans]|nr:FAR-17a/AIG1-like protein-domain-containing protein [Thamnidium elegans]